MAAVYLDSEGVQAVGMGCEGSLVVSSQHNDDRTKENYVLIILPGHSRNVLQYEHSISTYHPRLTS